MSYITLSPKSRKLIDDVETSVKEKYMKTVQSMSATELKSFSKHHHMTLMTEEIKQLLPSVDPEIIKNGCLPIANALHSECQSLLSALKRNGKEQQKHVTVTEPKHPTKQATADENEDLLDNLDDELLLSDSFQQLAITQQASQLELIVQEETVLKAVETNDEENTIAKATTGNTDQKESSANAKKSKKAKSSTIKKKNTTSIDCICDGRITDSQMIKCNWCMTWYHDICVGIDDKDTVYFWICTECRQLPKMVRNIEMQLRMVLENNEKLNKQLTEKTRELEHLHAENARLRQRLSNNSEKIHLKENGNNIDIEETAPEELQTPQPQRIRSPRNSRQKKKPSGTLLIGSSIIRDINTKNYELDVKPICIRGGKISDITHELLKQPLNTRYENIILQAGSNDCTPVHYEDETFREDYRALISTAKIVAENVVISGMCPRLTDAGDYIAKGNRILEKLASDENCHFVNNEPDFRRLNGIVNLDLFNRDGVHLNFNGTRKLASNLEIKARSAGNKNSHVRQNRTERNSGQYNTQRNRMHTERQNSLRRDNIRDRHQRRVRGDNNEHRPSKAFYNENVDVRCWYCGETNHTSSVCRHGTEIQCHECYEYGHKSKFCSIYHY